MTVRNISIWKNDPPVSEVPKRPKYLTGYEYHIVVETLEILVDTGCLTQDEYMKVRRRMDERVE